MNDPATQADADSDTAREPAPPSEDQALDVIRDENEQSDGTSWLDDLLLAAAIVFFVGGTAYLLWSRRHEHGAQAD